MGCEVAVGVFVGVGEGVEVLAQLLRGGVVGGEQGSPTKGLAHVEVALGSRFAVARATFSNASLSCAAK